MYKSYGKHRNLMSLFAMRPITVVVALCLFTLTGFATAETLDDCEDQTFSGQNFTFSFSPAGQSSGPEDGTLTLHVRGDFSISHPTAEFLTWDIEGHCSDVAAPAYGTVIQQYAPDDVEWEQSFAINSACLNAATSDSSVTISLDLSSQVDVYGPSFVCVELTYSTECIPPEAPTSPNPPDGEVDVSVDTELAWNFVPPPLCDLANGGFESGTFAPWTNITGPGSELTPWNVTDHGGFFGNGFPFEGAFFAQNGFDGDAGLFYDIYQEITIPADATSAILNWSERIQWSMIGVIPREYRVTIQPSGGGSPLALLYSMDLNPGTSGDTGYVPHSVDLLSAAPGIAGQTVRINFHEMIPETYTGPAQFDLDGVELVCNGSILQRETLPGTPGGTIDYVQYNQLRQEAIAESADIPTVLTTVPDGFSIRDGMLVEGQSQNEPSPVVVEDPAPSLPLVGATLINFDDILAPCVFMQTVRLTSEYAALGVNFEGPGGNDGGAILNECGNFSVSGHSSPNFLAFNAGAHLSDGGTPLGPETIHFNPAVSQVQALVGSGLSFGQLTMEAYNGIVPVDSATIMLSSVMQPISVSGTGITRVVVFTNANIFVLDDLQFTPGNVPCSSHITYDVYFGTDPDPNNMELIADDICETNCDPTPEPCEMLDECTEFYWQVVATSPCGSATGPVWNLKTGRQDGSVCNMPPDCSGAVPSTAEIWPPNHKWVNVEILGVTDPDNDPVSITITGITQDEPVAGQGSGNTLPDGDGVGTSIARLRAERTGLGNGRTYEISFEATDTQGGICNGTVQVCVPHSMGRSPHDATPGRVCTNDGQIYDSDGSELVRADLNSDGVIDQLDFALLADYWFASYELNE